MRKSLIVVAAMAAVASCSNESEVAQNGLQAVEQQEAVTYVSFGTYSSRQTSTRAGYSGSITDTELKDNTKANGFGVFAYFTGAKNYGSQDDKRPNFMYNEHIYSTAESWMYDILKPWPNGNGTADQSGATGDENNKISFFAYAPYVSEGTTWADEASGIIGMSANTDTGNPTISYKMASDGKTVDLLWGTAPEGTYETVTGTDQTIDANHKVPGGLYPVNINLYKQKTDETIDFLFKHALAKMGGAGGTDAKPLGLQVVLDIDKDGALSGGDKKDYQIVTIKEINIECDKEADPSNPSNTINLRNSGKLDLATGIWHLDDAPATAVKIKHDIVSPASSTTSSEKIRTSLAEPASVAKSTTGFNTLVATLKSEATGATAGVQTTPKNVYGATDAHPMVFFPGQKPVIKFTIEYVVRTKDSKLADGYSEVTQKITKTVSFTNAIELNKQYNIIMHLGLTNIKFTASVSSWDESGTTGGTGGSSTSDDVTVDLPINVK